MAGHFMETIGTPAKAAARRLARALTAGSGAEGEGLLAAMVALSVLVAPLVFLHSFCDTAISLVAVLFLYRSYRRDDFAWAREPWFIAALAFSAFETLRGIFTTYPHIAVVSGLVWMRFPVFVAAQCALFRTVPRLKRRVFWAYALTVAFAVADALYQRTSGHDIFGWTPAMDGTRLTDPDGKLDVGMILTLIGMPIVVWALAAATDRGRAIWLRLAAVLALLALTAAILFSGERMAFLLFIAAGAVALKVIGRLRWRAIGIIAGAGAIAASLVVAASPPLRLRATEALWQFSHPHRSAYLEVMHGGLRVFAANPVVGIGFRQYRYDCARYQPPGVPHEVCADLHPHQIWIENLAEGGVVGTGLILAVLILMLAPAVRDWRRWRDEPLFGGAAMAVLLRLWPLATTSSFYVSQREIVFWPLMAFAVAMASWRPDEV